MNRFKLLHFTNPHGAKSYNMVNSYVQNRQPPRLEVLTEIAEILNVDVRDLIMPTKKHDQK
jgi:transcriptional regulator with XRE-family HTH domain